MYLARNTIFTSLTGNGTRRHFTWSSEPREGLAICRAKGVPSFLSHFKILSVGPVAGIQPAISRNAVKRSTTELILLRLNSDSEVNFSLL